VIQRRARYRRRRKFVSLSWTRRQKARSFKLFDLGALRAGWLMKLARYRKRMARAFEVGRGQPNGRGM